MRLLALLTVCLVPIAAYSSDAPGGPKPKAKSVLKKVVKSFGKQKSYHVELGVTGGFSSSKDHKLSRQQVNQSYEADYYRGLLAMDTPRILRNRDKGAIRQAGSWYQLLAHPDGTLVQRLFHYPDQVIKDALVKGAKVTWVEGETKTVVAGTGHTGVAKTIEVAPERLLIELPKRVALKKYSTIQTSGATSDC